MRTWRSRTTHADEAARLRREEAEDLLDQEREIEDAWKRWDLDLLEDLEIVDRHLAQKAHKELLSEDLECRLRR